MPGTRFERWRVSERVTSGCECNHREFTQRDGHYARDKDHIPYTRGRQPILRPHWNAVSLMIISDAVSLGLDRWTPTSFAILSQGVVPCYHHMVSTS
jgi:hypothetical protein